MSEERLKKYRTENYIAPHERLNDWHISRLLKEQQSEKEKELYVDVTSIIDYIDVLENESFEGWTKKEKNSYLTACKSIKVKVYKTLEKYKPKK